jgi:hypothetical protein
MASMGISAFKDRVGSKVDFPVGMSHLEQLLPDVPFAAYFISTSTRVRQAVSLRAERLPVFRIQRAVPLLRVMNDFISPEARLQSVHLIVYAIPSARKRAIKEAIGRFDLLALERDFQEAMVYHEASRDLEIEAGLPNWF